MEATKATETKHAGAQSSATGATLSVGLAAMLKLRKRLRIKASKERRLVGNDLTRIEGFHKGLWLGYEDAANEINKLIKAANGGGQEPRIARSPAPEC